MNRSLENIVEIGVNLMLAAAVVWLFLSVLKTGRETAIVTNKEQQSSMLAANVAEFNDLNGEVVEFARAIEIVTLYAGDLDLYVDSTSDGGYILISRNYYTKWETTSTIISSSFAHSTAANRVLPTPSSFTTVEEYMIGGAKQLLATNLSSKFATGKWKVYLAVNGERVGNCAGKRPTNNDTVTGIRLARTN